MGISGDICSIHPLSTLNTGGNYPKLSNWQPVRGPCERSKGASGVWIPLDSKGFGRIALIHLCHHVIADQPA